MWKVLGRIWTGIVAAALGAAMALVAQIVGQMTLGFPIDYLTWMLMAFTSLGVVLGVLIGPRNLTGSDAPSGAGDAIEK